MNATAAQINFIAKLVAERVDLYRALGEDRAAAGITGFDIAPYTDNMTKADASTAIGKLLDTNKEMKARANQAGATVGGRITEDGMYKMDGNIYKVQEARNGSGRLYAKALVKNGDDSYSFEYAPGIVTALRAEHRMTHDEAKEFGALYSVCVVCGRALTNEESIEYGIGPICRSRV